MAEIILKNKAFNNLIRQTIVETIQEVLRDPDFGLELQAWAQRRLKKSPKALIPLGRIKRKYR